MKYDEDMEEENKRLKQELTAFETEFIKIEDLLSRAQTVSESVTL